MMNQPQHRASTLAAGGLLAALTMLMTYFLSVPIGAGGACVNAGDAGVYLAAFVLGGWPGALCAGIGSALADLLAGSVVYILPTFLFKAGTALLSSFLMRRFPRKARIFALLLSGLIIPVGYFFYEWVLYGVAVSGLYFLFNLIQWGIGVGIGFVLLLFCEKALHITAEKHTRR